MRSAEACSRRLKGIVMRSIAALRLTVCVLAVLLTAGYRLPASAAAPAVRPHRPRVILLDQSGRGSALSRNFRVNPDGRWGIAYAYRCLPHSGTFSAVIWDAENAAALGYTAFSSQGRSGHGLRMETGMTSNIWSPNGIRAGKVLSLQIQTRCAWHVRVIAGPRALVRRYIP